MSPKSKNLKMAEEKLNGKILSNDLVSDLKKDHNELSRLSRSFTNTLNGPDLRQSRKILRQIEDAAKSHFKFENNYLYPRMRRLMLVTLEKLCNEQMAIRNLIGKSQNILKKRNRLTKNGFVSEVAFAISRHLKNCDSVILLADKFGNEEKNELGQKLKECRREG